METLSKLLTVNDFKQAASEILEPPTLAYFNCGAKDGVTVQENRDAYSRLRLKPRLLRDVSNPNLTTEILGLTANTPIGIAPTAMHKMANEEGEIATALVAEEIGAIYITSMHATTSLEEIAKAAPKCRKWMNLMPHKGKVVPDLIRRAELAGYEALVVTIDAPTLGFRPALIRSGFKVPSHLKLANLEQYAEDTLKEYEGKIELRKFSNEGFLPEATWEFLPYLRSQTKLPIILKGIQSGEDALLAVSHGASAIYISNHGGRQLDNTVPTIEILPEVIEAVDGAVDVYIDGGIMSGADAFKALALGAKAVFTGRAVLWGLAVGGKDGVEKVLELLNDDLKTTMQLCGTRKVSQIHSKYVCWKKY